MNEAEHLLRAVGRRYAGLQTYRDRGRVLRADSPEAMVEFRTLFLRDVGLRFEFTREGHTEVVTAPAGNPDAIMDALAGPTGVSGGAAHTIPTLLLPESIGEDWSLLRLTAVHMVTPRGEHGQSIEGLGWAGQTMRVAVDPTTLLIRRVEDDSSARAGASTTEYEPDALSPVARKEVLG